MPAHGQFPNANSFVLIDDNSASGRYVRRRIVAGSINGRRYTKGHKVSNTPVIRFEENLLVMETQNISTSIPLDKVSGYTFSKSVVDGVADPDSDAETWVERRGDQLLFFPSDRGYEITVTGIDGKTLQVHKVDAGMSYTLTLDDLTSGIYLISTNNHTLKVAKK